MFVQLAMCKLAQMLAAPHRSLIASSALGISERFSTTSANDCLLRSLTTLRSKFMAHPIVSFDFGGGTRLCMSIETRKAVDQGYSAVGGIYRQYELIYLACDERDAVRVRTNYRKGEDLYLYHLRMPPERARTMFLEYMERVNALNVRPEFYNAITSNCTTNIRTQSAKTNPWDWRILLNGYADKMLYDRGDFAGDLLFDELKRRALINPAARAANDAPDFSQRIRLDRPGFGEKP